MSVLNKAVAASDPQNVREADAIEAGIEAASAYVGALPKGQQAWSLKEYKIAETAARAAVRHRKNQ